MSLSKPVNPPFVATAVGAPVEAPALGINENATRTNQLHGRDANNALGAGIPKQVSNVQVSVANAQTGSTCTVSVLFRTDPSDKNFSGVNIWVKGYQGNNQLVQVASGTSAPAKFVLNNTGETVSFTVQAYGNGGNAPLTQAPTCSGTLPKSTSGGFGSSTQVSSSSGLTMPVEFVVAGSGTSSIAVTKATESANTVWAGPQSGAAAQPGFRLLGPTDIPRNLFTPDWWGIKPTLAATTWNVYGSGTSVAGAVSQTVTALTSTGTEPYYLNQTSSAVASSSAGISWPNFGANQGFTHGIVRTFQSRVMLGSTASVRAWVCLVDTHNTLVFTALAADKPAQNVMGFRFSSAVDSHWQAYVGTDATHQTIVDTGITPDTNGHDYALTYDLTTVRFYIDFVLVASITTNIPAATTFYNVGVACDNIGLGNSKSIACANAWLTEV